MNTSSKLNELNKENMHSIEMTGLIIYSLACIFVCFSIAIRSHSILSIMAVIFAVVAMWYIFLTNRFDYIVRVILLSVCEGIIIWFYSYWSDSYLHVVIPVGVCSVLHILYRNVYCEYVDVFINIICAMYHIYYHVISGRISYRFILLLLVQVAGIYLLQFLCIFIIKTMQHEREIQQELLDKLESAEDSKNDFMANMSHELRTPINSILGTSSILLDHPLPEEDKDYLYSLEESGHKLLNVVNDIMDYTMLDAKTLTLNESPYIITSVLNDTSNYVYSKNKNKNVAVFFDVDSSIPSSLLGDCEKITRIIHILLDNALKFTHAGSISLKVTYRTLPYGINLCIKVTDTGIGMDSKGLEQLRNGLFMADAKSARRHEGAGLGLSVASGLLALMNGFLIIDSSLGKGSEFTAVIPQKVLNSAPSVVVEHNTSYKVLIYINPELSSVKHLRNIYENSLIQMNENLNISYSVVRNIAELKSSVSYNNYTHILMSDKAYLDDKAYFDDLSLKAHIITITRQGEDLNFPENIRRLYNPFYSYHFAELLMNDNNIKPSTVLNAVRKFKANGCKILIVDDNKTNLKVIEGLLKKYGITSILCKSGAEALEKCIEKDYNFIFMDHMMPEMDGIETMRRIREISDAFFTHVPIIALTANAVGGAREMFLSEGFDDFISKPVNKRELERILLSYLPATSIEYINDLNQNQAIVSNGNKFVKPIVDDTISPKYFEIDKKSALELLNNDEDIYKSAVESYINDSVEYFGKLPAFYKSSDWEFYAIIVHAIKSSSQIIGAFELSKLAAELEDAAKSKDMKDKAELHKKMLKIYQTIVDRLKD